MRGYLVGVADEIFSPLDESPPSTPKLHPPVMLDFEEN